MVEKYIERPKEVIAVQLLPRGENVEEVAFFADCKSYTFRHEADGTEILLMRNSSGKEIKVLQGDYLIDERPLGDIKVVNEKVFENNWMKKSP